LRKNLEGMDVRLIQIDHNPSRRQLNVFGGIWLVFFAVGGGIVLHRAGPTAAATALCVLAVAVPAVGWCMPAFMRTVYLAMAYATLPIGLVVSHLILGLVYYAVLTPIGLVLRLCSYDPMKRRLDPEAESYWVPREQEEDIEGYFRQF